MSGNAPLGPQKSVAPTEPIMLDAILKKDPAKIHSIPESSPLADIACKVGNFSNIGDISPITVASEENTFEYVPLLRSDSGNQVHVNVNDVARKLLFSAEEIKTYSDQGVLLERILGMSDRIADVYAKKMVAGVILESTRETPSLTNRNIVVINGKDQTMERMAVGGILGEGMCGCVYKVSTSGQQTFSALKQQTSDVNFEYPTVEKVLKASAKDGSWPEGLVKFSPSIKEITDLQTGQTAALKCLRLEICKCDGKSELETRATELRELSGQPRENLRQEHFRLGIENIASVFSGYSWLHDNKIQILDIKPENILIKENGNAVVSDLDTSAFNQDAMLADELDNIRSGYDATVPIEKTKVFGMGVLAYEILKHTSLIPLTRTETNRKGEEVEIGPALTIDDGDYELLSEMVNAGFADHPELANFLLRMLSPNHNERPSIIQSRDFFKRLAEETH